MLDPFEVFILLHDTDQTDMMPDTVRFFQYIGNDVTLMAAKVVRLYLNKISERKLLTEVTFNIIDITYKQKKIITNLNFFYQKRPFSATFVS